MVSLIDSGRAELAQQIQSKVNDFNLKNLKYAAICSIAISALHALRFYGGVLADVSVTVPLIAGYAYWSQAEKERQQL